ncbi:TY-Chap domain-containing protein [Actinomadura rugatobispora]|uniref:TY-Chap N-terminal domain-containing protein n=1 Tax=Actinomadura rugatobispora TaxID=1994 RepID=A0ABW0ZRX2_9ACTN|nr:hypothetical protein GCM10010200_027920 [Actinomadura rugatobispora]
MDWDEFARGLAEEFAVLPAGALLVLSEPGESGRYAQFAQGPDELVAYVVADSFLSERARATPEGARAIARAGWREPDPSAGHENWWQVLPWPASSRQYRALAESVAAALRDGYGISTPGGWSYQAWNETTGEDLELRHLRLSPA